MKHSTMTSNKPYLIRAFYDWIVDNSCSPYMQVNTSYAGVNVPPETINNGVVVFNTSTEAVEGFTISDEWVTFSARFSGRSTYIEFPIASIEAIYAKENGEGITFSIDDMLLEEAEKEVSAPQKPRLSLVD
jgi:stringent starvation protein B